MNRADLLRGEKFEVDPETEHNARTMLKDCADLEAMFDSPGWALVVELLTERQTQSMRALESAAATMDHVLAARARLSLIRELLKLPTDTAHDRQVWTDALKQEEA